MLLYTNYGDNATAEIHENVYSSEEALFQFICNDVRLKVAGLQKVDDNQANRS